MEEGEAKLNDAKTTLDNSRQEFLNQGINPDESTNGLKEKIENLKSLSKTMTSLSNDIKTTVNNLSGNEKYQLKRFSTGKV